MPELPDIHNYIEALEERLLNRRLTRVRIVSPFVLRTAVPPITELEGQSVVGFRRLGKRIAIGFTDELWLVIHLMIAGRLRWTSSDARTGGRQVLAVLEFDGDALVLTEAGTQKRASLHVVRGLGALGTHDPGGLEVATATLGEFAAVLRSENHTLKRALTDPHSFSGIGNAYSDEILHRARLSPVLLTAKLSDDQIAALFAATRDVLAEWTERLRTERAGEFPAKVTAFHDAMAVHGRFGLPCPRCGTKVQRIRYASNETNYCPRCQTDGRLLADRSLSRLLKQDWPRTIEAWEKLRER